MKNSRVISQDAQMFVSKIFTAVLRLERGVAGRFQEGLRRLTRPFIFVRASSETLGLLPIRNL